MLENRFFRFFVKSLVKGLVNGSCLYLLYNNLAGIMNFHPVTTIPIYAYAAAFGVSLDWDSKALMATTMLVALVIYVMK